MPYSTVIPTVPPLQQVKEPNAWYDSRMLVVECSPKEYGKMQEFYTGPGVVAEQTLQKGNSACGYMQCCGGANALVTTRLLSVINLQYFLAFIYPPWVFAQN